MKKRQKFIESEQGVNKGDTIEHFEKYIKMTIMVLKWPF